MRTALFHWMGRMASLASFAGALIALPARASELPLQPTALPGGYAMNLPAELRPIPTSALPPHYPTEDWVGYGAWKNPDTSCGLLFFCHAMLPPEPTKGLPPLDMMTAVFVKAVAGKVYKGLTVDSRSTTILAGRTFERVEFHGTISGIAKPERAFAYVGYEGSRHVVSVFAEDEEPYSSQVLPALNAAALTLTERAAGTASAAPLRNVSSANAPAPTPSLSFSGRPVRPFTASANASAQLARARTLVCGGEYSVRLPCGYVPYTVASLTVPLGQQLSMFRSINPDNTHPVIVISTAVVAPSMRSPKSVAVLMTSALNAFAAKKKLSLRQFRQYPVERGTLSSIPCCRVQFQGVTAAQNTTGLLTDHGFAYVGYDHGSMFCIIAENPAPYSDRTLPLQEASALSLTRRPAW